MIQNPWFNPYGMPYIKIAIILAYIEYTGLQLGNE